MIKKKITWTDELDTKIQWLYLSGKKPTAIAAALTEELGFEVRIGQVTGRLYRLRAPAQHRTASANTPSKQPPSKYAPEAAVKERAVHFMHWRFINGYGWVR